MYDTPNSTYCNFDRNVVLRVASIKHTGSSAATDCICAE